MQEGVTGPLLCRLLNHATADDIVGDGIRALRFQPSLSHDTFDNVPLNPSAIWARKCSQILAGAAWFNRR
jgi:hypothetical protein